MSPLRYVINVISVIGEPGLWIDFIDFIQIDITDD